MFKRRVYIKYFQGSPIGLRQFDGKELKIERSGTYVLMKTAEVEILAEIGLCERYFCAKGLIGNGEKF